MNLDSVKAVVTSKAARQLLVTQKHSPKILFAAGVTGMIGTVVLACRATLKLDVVLTNLDVDTAKVNVLHDQVQGDAYSDQARDKDLTRLKVRAALDIAKMYTPAIGVGLVSVAALTGSHVVLTKRNAGVMAAYAALDRGFKEYRERVSDEYGKDVDRKFASGAEPVAIEEKTSDGKTKTTTKDMVKKGGKFAGSPYAALFDETSGLWSREPGRNQMTLAIRQSQCNDKLRMQGHIFLNEVYDYLGLPRTKAGAQVGWVYRKDNEEKTGDNYVDFGVFSGDDVERIDAFVYGEENSIWLDFNVDGLILDLI